MELWKDIKGYENLYQISNYGNIRSLKKWCGNKYLDKWVNEIKYLKPTDNGNGYLIINLKKDGIRKSFYMHRLVAEHFLEKENNKNIVNHKDYNKYNNRYDNLEYCTQKENIKWSLNNMQHRKQKENKLNKQYIRKKGKKYELTLKKKYIGMYDTIDQAIKVRNMLIEGDNYYDGFDYTK